MRRTCQVLSSHCLLVAMAIVVVTTLLPEPVRAELTKPRASDRRVTLVVSHLMGREHLSKHPLDDEISARGLKSFLESLDPMKVYFTAGDIAEFEQKKKEIDEMIQKGDISFAYTIFNRFLERIEQRVATVDQLLKTDLDFTADEEMVIDRDEATYAKDEAESLDRWKKRIKYDLLVLKGDKKEGKEALEKLSRRYHSFLKRMKQTDGDELLEMFLTAVTSSYDPHTTYMSPSSLDNFRILMSLNLDGIGAALKFEDGYTVVTKIIPAGAADKHGKLKVEDRIVSVGQGEDGEMVDVVDMKLGDVVKMIRGKAGTIVRLGVIPAGSSETKIYPITREKIKLEDSAAQGEVIEDGAKEDGSKYKLGVIDLPSFYMDMQAAREGKTDFRSTTEDVRKILKNFRSKDVDAVILDLRRNGGGSLTEAINLTGLFIDDGPVVQVKDSANRIQSYDDLEAGMEWSGPLVVLTSKFSASASEILAGAIQDYRRGIVVGDEATHGKGTVQSLLDLGAQLFRVKEPPNYGALKITMQQFYRPNGDSTQKRGVLADIVLPSITNHMDVAESDLDFAMDFDKIPAAGYKATAMVRPEMLTKLREASQKRRMESEDFDKLLKNIERYREQKAKKKLSLNEKKFFAARAELDADKEEEKQLVDDEKGDKPVFERNYYNDEVLDITIDYIKLLQDAKVATK
ncbi:MAG TPA: tail-specific protease [Planctomycetaceae bacterium]|nr:tail-specific protease [Blastopirellula sp.]HAY79971.1 tail-specific protease [Planctomycetaceae bacterium]